jgi:hypothetical protein
MPEIGHYEVSDVEGYVVRMSCPHDDCLWVVDVDAPTTYAIISEHISEHEALHHA